MPLTTLPTTVYWPSRLETGANMMKNCELAESGFCARAMPTVPRLIMLLGEFGRQIRQLGAAGARPLGVVAALHIAEFDVAGLGHEAVDDPVKGDVVVGALAHQRLDRSTCLGARSGRSAIVTSPSLQRDDHRVCRGRPRPGEPTGTSTQHSRGKERQASLRRGMEISDA